MDIYVESRGYSPDFGYCWKPEVPKYLHKISGLIQSEFPSVVIARFDKDLMLLVTGLESQEKTDFRDRPVRHSIAWVCEYNDENESKIRSVAIEALQDTLRSKVDKYINFDSKNGFEFSSLPPDISELVSIKLSESKDLSEEEKLPKIGKANEYLKKDLIEKLQEFRMPKDSLPKEFVILVVVTGIKSEEVLKKAGIWRSLSSLVKSEDWEEVPISEAENQNFRVAIAIIAGLTIAALALLILLLHPLTPKPEIIPSPTPTLSPANKVIEENLEKTEQQASTQSLEKALIQFNKQWTTLEEALKKK